MDDYHEVNEIEVFLAEEESDDEYASADEFLSSDEAMFSRDDSVMTECVEEGQNVIVPCFGAPSHFEVRYHGKQAITPLVISLRVLSPTSHIRLYRGNVRHGNSSIQFFLHLISGADMRFFLSTSRAFRVK